jgi:Spy/CpxP family protein refolding chaperone
VAELAKLLDEVKTERAQAEVDDRRTLADFADALAGENFDAAKAATAGDRRTASAAKLRDTVVRFLQQVHAILNPEQRARLAYLIRTGALSV